MSQRGGSEGGLPIPAFSLRKHGGRLFSATRGRAINTSGCVGRGGGTERGCLLGIVYYLENTEREPNISTGSWKDVTLGRMRLGG